MCALGRDDDPDAPETRGGGGRRNLDARDPEFAVQSRPEAGGIRHVSLFAASKDPTLGKMKSAPGCSGPLNVASARHCQGHLPFWRIPDCPSATVNRVLRCRSDRTRNCPLISYYLLALNDPLLHKLA